MDVSVVIPLFNKAPHVAQAVRSALEQSLAAKEVIVVDDGSTDGGLQIVEAMQDPRIRILTRSAPGPGGYAARNLGVRNAACEWVAFLDADDLWRPGHLAGLASAVEACGGGVGCAFSRFEMVFENTRSIYPVAERAPAPGAPLSLGVILDMWLDEGKSPLWTGAVAFRRELLIEAGLFPEGRANRGGDKDLWLRAIARTGAAFAPACSAEFHQETTNRVSKNTPHSEAPIITQTIRSLLPTVNREDRKRLRRLSNLEIALYARYAAGARRPLSARVLSQVYLPEGVGTIAWMLAMLVVGNALKLVKPT